MEIKLTKIEKIVFDFIEYFNPKGLDGYLRKVKRNRLKQTTFKMPKS